VSQLDKDKVQYTDARTHALKHAKVNAFGSCNKQSYCGSTNQHWNACQALDSSVARAELVIHRRTAKVPNTSSTVGHLSTVIAHWAASLGHIIQLGIL